MLIINILVSLTLLAINTGVINKTNIVSENSQKDIPIEVKVGVVEDIDLNRLDTERTSVILDDAQVENVKKDFESRQADVTYKPPEVKKEIVVAKKVITPKVSLIKPPAAVETVAKVTEPEVTKPEPVKTDIPVDFETYIVQMCTKYGCNPDQLKRVMYCESGGRADALNKAGPYIGLFQFSLGTFKGYAAKIKTLSNPDVYNPYHQIEVAAYMFSKGLSSHWGCK